MLVRGKYILTSADPEEIKDGALRIQDGIIFDDGSLIAYQNGVQVMNTITSMSTPTYTNENLFFDLTLIIGKDYIDLPSYRDAVLFQPPF